MRTSPPSNSEAPRPRPPGFTLVELMLVLGLLMVVMFLAVPTFQGLLQGSLQEEVNRLSGVIRLLRNEAVLTNTRYRLLLDLEQGRYAVERQDVLGGYETVREPRVLSPHDFPPELAVAELELLGRVYRPDEPEPLPVVVDASGYVDPFLLRFTHEDEEYTLRVSGFTGNVELLEGYVDARELDERDRQARR